MGRRRRDPGDGRPLPEAPLTRPGETSVPEAAHRVDRTRARSWVLQTLYRWESQGEVGSVSDTFDEVRRTRRVLARRVPLIERHVRRLDEHLQQTDKALRAALDNWRLERVSRVDRCILRLAASEILFDPEVPPRVALHEGIRLAGQYGGPDSTRFVNGVLDAVLRQSSRAP